ncbi:MAG: adenylate/guanylate cyclase protein [Solirubrobacterales bacterium]|nr:adenylate/guanylate cyclase protein [Solirubrobacterales bacterium]
MVGPVQYARNGDATLAFRIVGDGDIDVLFVPGMLSHIEVVFDEPGMARFFNRMGEFCRVIVFDRRGTGMSDQLPDDFTLEEDATDLAAILDAAGSERSAVLGYTGGGALAAQFAAMYPERCRALLFYAPIIRTMATEGYEWASKVEDRVERFAAQSSAWGQGSILGVVAASRADDERLRSWLGRLERGSLSPGTLKRMLDYQETVDARGVLEDINVPTLALHRTDDPLIDVRHSRYVADHVPGAKLVELPGSDNLPSMGDSEALLGELEEFLTGGRRGGVQRAMLTVLFTDIVDSTGHAARVGDGQWRDLLAHQERDVREVVERYNGNVVKTIGDAFLIVFDGPPSSALRCARAIVDAVRAMGLELHVGLHTGECEIIGEDVGGMAVHIASRVASLAEPGEILASGTAYGTVVGSGLSFTFKGSRELKGVPGTWPIFALDE